MSGTARRIEFPAEAAGERIDRALADAAPELSRVQWARLIDDGAVTLDGKPVKASLRLHGGETVEALVPEVVEAAVAAEAIPLDVRYEDADLIVVNKPAGMVVHPSFGHTGRTLVNALLAHCPDLAGVGGERRPGIVHRLDKETSGLIIAAKHDRALWALQAQFKERTVQKVYLALVNGPIQPPDALIDAPVGRDPKHRKKMAVVLTRGPQGEGPEIRPAQTRYKTLRSFQRYSYLECRPRTGRKHQIRVHLAYLGYPVVGDALYGRRKDALALDRHFLHATRLTFRLPSTGDEMTVEAELPADLQAVLDALE